MSCAKKMISAKIGEMIRGARKKKGMTQKHLGELLGVANGTVCDWEKGRSVPGGEKMYLIAEILDFKFPR